MANERLREAMIAAQVTIEDVCTELDVELKTVERWLIGRRPQRRYRWSLAQLVDVDERILWPEAGSRATGAAAIQEVVGAYTHRADLAPERWWSMFHHATGQIDILGYALLFLSEAHPGLGELLAAKGAGDCPVRIALVDPDSEQARARDAEEELDGGLIARIRTSARYLAPLVGRPGVSAHYHATPLYNSLFRFGQDMFVTPHLYGTPGYAAPLLHLRRVTPDGIFDRYAEHFEAIWRTSTPIAETS